MKQDINYVIMRHAIAKRPRTDPKPVKSIEDRADARTYAARMNARSKRYCYKAVPVKKG